MKKFRLDLFAFFYCTLSHSGLLTLAPIFQPRGQIGRGESPRVASPVGALVLPHGLRVSSRSAGPALDGNCSAAGCGLPCPHPPSCTHHAPFSRSQLLGSPMVPTDGTLTLFTFSVPFPFFLQNPFFPTRGPGSFFWSLSISPSCSYPLLQEAHQPFKKWTNPVLCYGITFLFCRFLNSNLLPPIGNGCAPYLKLHLIYIKMQHLGAGVSRRN